MDIETRVTRLEKDNRSLRRLLVGALLLAALPWLYGAGADEVRTRRLVVEDDSGKPCLVAGKLRQGYGLGVLDSRGAERIQMTRLKDESIVIVVSEPSEVPRVIVGLEGPSGVSGIALADGQGNDRLQLQVGSGGSPVLRTLDSEKREGWKAP